MTGKLVKCFEGSEKSETTTLRHSRSSSWVAFGSRTGLIELMNSDDLVERCREDDVSSKKAVDSVRRLEGHTEQITKLLELPDGTLLSSSKDETIRLWDPETGECLWFTKTEYQVCNMVLLPDNRSIAIGGNCGQLEVFRMTWLRLFENPHSTPPSGVSSHSVMIIISFSFSLVS